ncbi:hypothetical protein B296_00043756 [Ensete ventricosum]|uniref:Transcription termination factor MTEF18, mitochondrial-like n=1 Tax=Ensete ventricosum TaxID=4639 RepID=A0A426Y918_ENSVE|nr:hypothetical protein B296_00043756 [Ensete ventricosum]
MIRRRLSRSIGSSKMPCQLSSLSILPAVSPGILGSSKKTPFKFGKGRHSLCRIFLLPASSAVQKYQPTTDRGDVKFSSTPSYDLGRTRLGVGVSLNVLFPNNWQNHQPHRSFSANSALVDTYDGCAGSRISRVNRANAQKALFEYLHETRSLPFTDADHISNNSPVFLQNLLSEVDDVHNAGRSITNFLRYHPINEFEPFFESLGLKPSKLDSLVPCDIMFLSDDEVLLENYHVLCDYGVPRSKIGKMYKEGTDMFRYGYGVLYTKLQAYEKLGLGKPTVSKLVQCCPTLLVGDVDDEFLQLLEKLRSIGVELDGIRGCLSDKRSYNWSRILQMLSFLDGMHCSKDELAALIKSNPRFIFYDSGNKLCCLVATLLKVGIKMNSILVLFVQYPQLLVGNFPKKLSESVQFLAEIGMASDDIARILSSHVEVLGSCSYKEPSVVLSSLNLSAKRLCEIIKEDPLQFTNLASMTKAGALAKGVGRFLEEKTNFLLKLGFVENSDDMAKALSKFRGRGDQLQERFDCLMNAGLDCHTASEMVKFVPTILNQSTETIKKKIDYLLNNLGYPLESLVAYPAYLCYSMDKIKLRFSMYFWLKEQGLPTDAKRTKMSHSTITLSTILACSEERFTKYFVNIHPGGPNEWKKLKGSVSLR